jgi:transcriptional regulator with XRE-family HTH domain
VVNREVLNSKFLRSLEQVRKDFPQHNKTFIAQKVLETQLNVLNGIINGTRKVTPIQLERYIAFFKLNKNYFYAQETELYHEKPEPLFIDNTIFPEVKARYKTVRTYLQKTQEEIAREINRNQTQWSQIENGVISPGDDIKSMLHNKYNIAYEYLIDGVLPIVKGEATVFNINKQDERMHDTLREVSSVLEQPTARMQVYVEHTKREDAHA